MDALQPAGLSRLTLKASDASDGVMEAFCVLVGESDSLFDVSVEGRLEEKCRMSVRPLTGKEQVEKLVLNGKELGDASAAFVGACALRYNGALDKLQQLVLHNNQIGDAGCTALAKTIEAGALAGLKDIVLHQNCIGDEGAAALARARAVAEGGGEAGSCPSRVLPVSLLSSRLAR